MSDCCKSNVNIIHYSNAHGEMGQSGEELGVSKGKGDKEGEGKKGSKWEEVRGDRRERQGKRKERWEQPEKEEEREGEKEGEWTRVRERKRKKTI